VGRGFGELGWMGGELTSSSWRSDSSRLVSSPTAHDASCLAFQLSLTYLGCKQVEKTKN
jgi:hypothetical protein